MKDRVRFGIAPLMMFALAACSGDEGPASPGDRVPPGKVNDFVACAGSPGSVTFYLTAPGDDDHQGTATRYEVRHARFPADPECWPTWDHWAVQQPPRPAGAPDTVTVAGLADEAAYAFRLRAADDAGNWSDPSNLVIASACERLDTTSPQIVADLQLWTATNSSITVSWTAPGDDGRYGTAAAYDLRYANSAITADTWDAAQIVPDLPAPQAAGTRQTATVAQLVADTEYHLALKTRDEQGNWSGISNASPAITRRFRTWYVKPDGSGDAPTIQAACVDSARPGDVILVAPGQYTWTNQGEAQPPEYGMIFFPRDVTGFELRSEAGPDRTIIDAERQGRVFFIQGISPGSTSNVTIDGFTITGGNSFGSAQGDSGKTGGGMVVHLCSPTIRNCIFRGNVALYGGGFAQAGVGSPRLENCVFEDNEADAGAAIGLWTAGSYPEIIGCTIRYNEADVAGAGLYAGRVSLTMDGCCVHHNRSGNKGGGAYLAETGPSTLIGCTFADNMAATGGAIRVVESQLGLQNCIIAHSQGGGAVRAYGINALQVGCCDIFGNVGGDDLPSGHEDRGGNFSLDPTFCGGQDGSDYRLQGTSVCAPGQHPGGVDCGLIGACGVGCAPWMSR